MMYTYSNNIVTTIKHLQNSNLCHIQLFLLHSLSACKVWRNGLIVMHIHYLHVRYGIMVQSSCIFIICM